jgi:transposase
MAPIDMWRGFDRLDALAQQVTCLDPSGGHLRGFRCAGSDCVKVHYWARDGYALWCSR